MENTTKTKIWNYNFILSSDSKSYIIDVAISRHIIGQVLPPNTIADSFSIPWNAIAGRLIFQSDDYGFCSRSRSKKEAPMSIADENRRFFTPIPMLPWKIIVITMVMSFIRAYRNYRNLDLAIKRQGRDWKRRGNFKTDFEFHNFVLCNMKHFRN